MLPPLTCRTNSVTWTHILTLDTARGQKGGSIPPLLHRPDSGDYIGLTEIRQRMKMGSKCATHRVQNCQGCQTFNGEEHYVPGDGIKRDQERENCAVLTIAAQTANSIHIRVMFNGATR